MQVRCRRARGCEHNSIEYTSSQLTQPLCKLALSFASRLLCTDQLRKRIGGRERGQRGGGGSAKSAEGLEGGCRRSRTRVALSEQGSRVLHMQANMLGQPTERAPKQESGSASAVTLFSHFESKLPVSTRAAAAPCSSSLKLSAVPSARSSASLHKRGRLRLRRLYFFQSMHHGPRMNSYYYYSVVERQRYPALRGACMRAPLKGVWLRGREGKPLNDLH